MKNRYLILRMIFAAAAAAAGGAYLLLGASVLKFALPVMCAAFWAIAVVAWRESRASGATGLIAMLPAVAGMIVAGFATVGVIAYFAMG